MAEPSSANKFIEDQLNNRLQTLEDKFTAHAVTFCGPILFGVDDLLRTAVEERHAQAPARNKLIVLLTTTGGYIEVVQRMVDTLRHHYSVVDFIVPNHAFSAGTVFVMSGDAIHMDYYSRLGPIDPQVEAQSGKMVPALGYLEKYRKLIEKAQNGEITTAEVTLLVDGFDQAELYQYEQAREQSVDLLKKWLVKYKFKDWKRTRTHNRKVTKRMRESRAAGIARELNKTEKWHSHGHGIAKDILENDINLIIDDFGSNSGPIREYHDLLSDYMSKLRTNGVIHCVGAYRPFM